MGPNRKRSGSSIPEPFSTRPSRPVRWHRGIGNPRWCPTSRLSVLQPGSEERSDPYPRRWGLRSRGDSTGKNAPPNMRSRKSSPRSPRLWGGQSGNPPTGPNQPVSGGVHGQRGGVFGNIDAFGPQPPDILPDPETGTRDVTPPCKCRNFYHPPPSSYSLCFSSSTSSLRHSKRKNKIPEVLRNNSMPT